MSHRPAQSYRLTPRQKEELEFLIVDAAELNHGLGCVDYVQCAKKICDSQLITSESQAVDQPKTFADTISEIFGSGVPNHYRHSVVGKVIGEMIKSHLLSADEEGIYCISGALLESSA